MIRVMFVVALLALAPVTSAAARDVATFLLKAEALQKKGPMAIFSSDVGVVVGEVKNSMQAIKAERLAAEAAGRHGAYCPTGKASLDQDELLTALRATPPTERMHDQLKDALRTALAKKYPCPA